MTEVSRVERHSRGKRAADSGAQRTTRRGRWVLAFWVGVLLAPLATVFLLLGEGVGSLRVTAVLAILSSVLIGLSVVFRDDAEHVRQELADEFRSDMERMRADVETLRRGMQLTVNRELERVRGELEEARSVIRAESTRLPAHNTQQILLSAVQASPPARYSYQTDVSYAHQSHSARAITGDVLAPSEYEPSAPYRQYDSHGRNTYSYDTSRQRGRHSAD